MTTSVSTDDSGNKGSIDFLEEGETVDGEGRKGSGEWGMGKGEEDPEFRRLILIWCWERIAGGDVGRAFGG